jgi:hypothetical protein
LLISADEKTDSFLAHRNLKSINGLHWDSQSPMELFFAVTLQEIIQFVAIKLRPITTSIQLRGNPAK